MDKDQLLKEITANEKLRDRCIEGSANWYYYEGKISAFTTVYVRFRDCTSD